MKYDDASWHYGGNFPADLEDAAGATHIALFVAWCVLNGLAGELHVDDLADDLETLRARDLTPGAWFLRACDGKFTDEDVDGDGNAFTAAYYDAREGQYLDDYERVLAADRESIYHVPDTWASYDALAPVIAGRLRAWWSVGT